MRGKAVVAVATMAGMVLMAGGRTAACLAASPAAADPAAIGPSLSTAITAGVIVHKGQTATVRYRADGPAGGAVTMDVVVVDAAGRVVRTLVQDRPAAVGVAQTWHGRIGLATGRYVLVAHARDAAGRPESRATPAVLEVLKAPAPQVPSAGARRAAFAWAARRAGRVAAAVVDSRGRLYGYQEWEPFTSASVVKAMLLVAYLRGHDTVSAPMRGVLARMIDYSDNAAADVVYGSVGRGGLERLARLTGMRGFRATGAWITTQVTAADLARFFRDMHAWVPPHHRHLADWLLGHVTPYQSWGIPAAAVPLGYRVYFKPGWLGAWVLANEAARVERDGLRLGLAVFTDGNPAPDYGKETIAGVTERLLRR